MRWIRILWTTGPRGKSWSSILRKFKGDTTTFQVHQWIATKLDAEGNEHAIGDWVIAERIEVRKGEYIGLEVPLQALAWNKFTNSFEVPEAVPVFKAGKQIGKKPGIVVNLMPPMPEKGNVLENMPPILVDFHGGKYIEWQQIEEETAVDALVMGADGSLMVFNSRDDSSNTAHDPGV